MLRHSFTILVYLVSITGYSQSNDFEKDYKSGATITATKSGKDKFSLSYNHSSIADATKKIDTKKEAEDFYFSAVKDVLLKHYPTEQVNIIDWSRKFAQQAVEVFFNSNTENEILDRLLISDRYSINEIWTSDKGYIYFFSDNDPDGNSPTNILYKKNGKYTFLVTDIKTSPDTAIIIKNFPDIVSFIQKNKKISVPTILVVETTVGKYQLKIETQGIAATSFDITKGQAEQLKGAQISKTTAETIYALKEAGTGMVNSSNDKKTDDKASLNNETDEQEIGKYDIIIKKRNYTIELWKKDSKYYINLCGIAVDTVTENGTQKEKEIKKDSCRKSDGTVSGFDNNETSFRQMIDNDVKKMNKSVNTGSDEDYKNQVELAYVYFKAEVEKKEEKEKNDKFVADVIKQSHLDEIAKEELTTTKVGTIILRDCMINVYDENDLVIEKAKIDSVRFSIEGGKLSKKLLYAETEKGTFINRDAPIPVLRINDRTDILLNMDENVNTHLKLNELIKYVPDGGYVPDDAENIVLKCEKPRQDLNAASNLNSLVNFSIYTDLAGLLGRRANGLLMTDVTGRFITNSGNIRNMDVTLFSFIEGNVTLSKFDSKFKSIDSSDIKRGQGSQKDTVDRMKLMQTAWLKGNIKFNLFSCRLFSSQYFNVNIGARINVVNADSLFKTDRDVIFFDYIPELQYSINRIKNFGMELSLKWLLQRIADKEPFENKGWEEIFNPQIAFFYYPSRNPSSKIYLRFNYFANKKKDANNFYQLQFGWKTGLKLSK